MSKANALGTVLTVNSKTVGGLKSINGIEISADTIDVTALDSEGGYKEFVGGSRDAGEVTCSGFMDGANEGQAECLTLLNSGEVVACTIQFPAKIGKTWSFNAVVTKFSTGAELDNAVSFEAALKVSGKPTLGATAGAKSGNG